MTKTKKQTVKDETQSEEILPQSRQPEYTITFANSISVHVHNICTIFSVTPEDFQEVEVPNCFWTKKKMNFMGKKLIKEYNISPADCGKPGIDMKLAFQHVVQKCKNEPIHKIAFFGMPVVPDKREWQQETIDHGVPENLYVRYLDINIPWGFKPRVHERLNYDYLDFHQQYMKEEQRRVYHEVNEKMLRTQLLIISCLISNAEVLSGFKGWGLVVDYAQDNKVDKAFIVGIINNWIERKEVRRLTGLYDRPRYSDENGQEVYGRPIMSGADEELIIKRLTDASKCIETTIMDNKNNKKSKIKFTRSDGAQAILFISYEKSYCMGMAFLQPPHEELIEMISHPMW